MQSAQIDAQVVVGRPATEGQTTDASRTSSRGHAVAPTSTSSRSLAAVPPPVSPKAQSQGSWLEGRMWKKPAASGATDDSDVHSSEDGQVPASPPGQRDGWGAVKRGVRNNSAGRRRSSFFSASRKAMISGGDTAGKKLGQPSVWGGSTLVRMSTQRHGAFSELLESAVQIPDNDVLNNISEEDLHKPVLVLGELPQEFAEVLKRYDLDRRGQLDREQTIHCAADLARMRHQIENGTVHISAFPEFAQPLLEVHDVDCDGTLSVHEMISAFQALEREKQKAKLWFRMALFAFLFIILLLLSISGLLYYILDVMRDSDIRGSMMVVKDTDVPVQTASLELMVKGGRLVERNSERRCAGEEECPLQVAEAAERRAVTSALSDAVLHELRQLKVEDGAGAWVQLRVLAVQRLPDARSTHGSVVVVYSHLGDVELDGSKLKLTARLTDLLARSGIALSPGQDYLQSGEGEQVQLVGTFNSLSGK